MLQDASRYASHFLHPYQLPTAELHHDAMKPGSPTKLTHLLTFGIAVNLLHRGHPTGRQTGHRIYLSGGISIPECNYALLRSSVAGQAYQEHIAEAVVQLHRGHSQIIGINAQEIPLTEHGYEGNKAPWHN